MRHEGKEVAGNSGGNGKGGKEMRSKGSSPLHIPGYSGDQLVNVHARTAGVVALEEVDATDASTDHTDGVDVVALTRRVALSSQLTATSCASTSLSASLESLRVFQKRIQGV